MMPLNCPLCIRILIAFCCLASTLRSETHFTAKTLDDAVEIGYGLVIGDVDGNGWADILLADKTEFVWYENPGNRSDVWPRHVME